MSALTEPVVGLIDMGLGNVRYTTRWCYDPADPYAVTIIFPAVVCDADGRDVTWRFARDLLDDALRTGAAGTSGGQVFVTAGDGTVALHLRGDGGASTTECAARTVSTFLARTYLLVPRGEEQIGDAIDQLLASIHAGGA